MRFALFPTFMGPGVARAGAQNFAPLPIGQSPMMVVCPLLKSPGGHFHPQQGATPPALFTCRQTARMGLSIKFLKNPVARAKLLPEAASGSNARLPLGGYFPRLPDETLPRRGVG